LPASNQSTGVILVRAKSLLQLSLAALLCGASLTAFSAEPTTANATAAQPQSGTQRVSILTGKLTAAIPKDLKQTRKGSIDIGYSNPNMGVIIATPPLPVQKLDAGTMQTMAERMIKQDDANAKMLAKRQVQANGLTLQIVETSYKDPKFGNVYKMLVMGIHQDKFFAITVIGPATDKGKLSGIGQSIAESVTPSKG